MKYNRLSASRALLHRTLITLLLLGSYTFAYAAPPEKPGNLRYLVYSSTAAELFWDRPAKFGLTYDIVRNGAITETTDGVSHFDDQLIGGVDYEYQVIAINLQGERSAPASVILRTRDGTAGSGSTPTQPGAIVATPTGLIANVYSKSSAELFWDRPSTFGLTYEISRAGNVVETTDGVSYYDDQLSADTSYTYQVIALDQQGQRSQPASVSLNTMAGTTSGAGNNTS